MSPKIITLVRHGQAHNNVDGKYYLHDPYLTPLGETQCHELSNKFPPKPAVELLVSSPLKRTIQTTLLGFKKLVESGVKLELLAELQEASELPCDTGSSRRVLEKEGMFKGLDFSGLPEDWTSKQGKWAPDPDLLRERARVVRKWLKARSESHVVAVLHGGFLQYLTEDWAGHGDLPGPGWSNTEFRSYVFVDGGEDNVSIVETEESKKRRKGTEKPLGRTEMKQFEKVVRN
ncbi:phosphoglycerate mutase-like protein [Choiromyces venosus 120613-1]|uniref:Phosphoglycerate mutase-like protein n=1 Tax=Choiromyces venosus 120613-1 TaxID=1336337 RepID=A0A3N4JEW6_9PEZI|nr:phosphoglycerate mutase-like protein [Choiromyces venosus 120613-1]